MLQIRRAIAAGEIDLDENDRVEVRLTFSDGTEYPVSGFIDFLAYSVDQETGTVELRAERTGRAQSVVDADVARYDRFSLPAMAAIPAGAASGGWARRRIEGKLLSIVRLAKASLTYAGGIDYLAWKINRHAGTKIEIKPWQRRWPLVAALTLVPRLVKSGAIR